MAQPKSLAQFRDVVRRFLQLFPAIDDFPPGPVGDPSISCPDPNNKLIDECINNSISSINRIISTAQIMQHPIPVPLASVDARGVQYVDYSSEILPPNSLVSTMITNLAFSDGITTERMEPFTYYVKDRDYVAFQQYQPGRPVQWIVVGGHLGILPPSATKGTIYMDATIGIPPLVADTDMIRFLPIDYQDCIPYLACSILSGRQATDVEAMQRGQYFDTIGKQGILQIVQWMSGFDDTLIAAARDTLEMVPESELKRQIAARGASQQPPNVGEG